MSPTSRLKLAFISLFALVIFGTSLRDSAATGSFIARTQESGTQKKIDKPLYNEYKGVRIGMEAVEVRKKLGNPTDKSDVQDFYAFSENESAQIYYDKGKVMAVSVNYVGDKSGAPLPKIVLGTEIEAKADGAMYKLIRYPEAGYWVSYNRTGGGDPLVTVTMQRIH
jgi:hypothetical protein